MMLLGLVGLGFIAYRQAIARRREIALIRFLSRLRVIVEG
jgi:hypothetical protein